MPVLDPFTTITEMFDRLTERFLDDPRPVLLHKRNGSYQGISYEELRTWVDDIACGLADLGVQRGDRIALISENRPEWVVADMAMMKLGAVNVSIYPTLTPKQIEYILSDAGVKFVIVSNQFQLTKVMKIVESVRSLECMILFADKGDAADSRVISFSDVRSRGKELRVRKPDFLRDETKKVKPEDLLTIIYTSGTTGNPKGVMLTHANLTSNMQAAVVGIPFTHDDILLSFLPLCHSYERMGGYYTAMSCGAMIAYAESIETVRDNLLEVRPTVVTTVPRLFERIHGRLMKQVNEAPPLRQKMFHWAINVGHTFRQVEKERHVAPWLSLQHRIADALVLRKIRNRTGARMRFFVSGGAALSPSLGKFFEAVGLTIIEGYGMTESSPVISVNRLDDYKFGTVGKPIPDVTVRIAGDGEILVRGPNLMRGYWNNPQATAEAIDRDGWLHTGDIGVIDTDGFLTITDRKKHLFVSSGGKNIAPQHIENAFLESEYIDQFVLIGDGRMFLTALIVPRFEALRDHAREGHLAAMSDADLVESAEIKKLFEDEINRLQKDLANYERVRKFTILKSALTVENGEITPTMKVRRKVVEEKYKLLIDKMYEAVH